MFQFTTSCHGENGPREEWSRRGEGNRVTSILNWIADVCVKGRGLQACFWPGDKVKWDILYSRVDEYFSTSIRGPTRP